MELLYNTVTSKSMSILYLHIFFKVFIWKTNFTEMEESKENEPQTQNDRTNSRTSTRKTQVSKLSY